MMHNLAATGLIDLLFYVFGFNSHLAYFSPLELNSAILIHPTQFTRLYSVLSLDWLQSLKQLFINVS